MSEMGMLQQRPVKLCTNWPDGIRFPRMRAECAFLLFASTLSTVSFAQEKKVDQVGYIYCASDGADRSVHRFS